MRVWKIESVFLLVILCTVGARVEVAVADYERADANALLETGWRMPEPLVEDAISSCGTLSVCSRRTGMRFSEPDAQVERNGSWVSWFLPRGARE